MTHEPLTCATAPPPNFAAAARFWCRFSVRYFTAAGLYSLQLWGEGHSGCAAAVNVESLSSHSVFSVFAAGSPALMTLTSMRFALRPLTSVAARRAVEWRTLLQYADILACDARDSAKSVAIRVPGSTGSTTCSDAWPQQSSQDAHLAASFQRRIAGQSAIRQRFCIHAVFHTTRTSFSSVEMDGRSARISCTSQM